MYMYRYGGRTGPEYGLDESDEWIAVRTVNRAPLADAASARAFTVAQVSEEARRILRGYEPMIRFRHAGVEVLQAKEGHRTRAARDRARTVLKAEPAIQFAGRVLVDPSSQRPVVYTENFFVKFGNGAKKVEPRQYRAILERHGLTIKRSLKYASDAYFVGAAEGTGLAVFEIAESLLQEEIVALCHPELVRQIRHRDAFPQQWHLRRTTLSGQVVDAHANVQAAWSLSNGAGTTIAVIDTGIDFDHEEFRSSGKIVAERDVTAGTNNPRPRSGENHGTACAGVACANGQFGASGVAPGARLMPIRLASGLGSQQEANAFEWAADHGADVISCSWGPEDGDWTHPADPLHNQVVPLPDSTRLAMDYAVRNGRGGKGCVILFAAGNGNESVMNDGYASHSQVIAVAACNDTGRKSAYSDSGAAVWCAFPSNDGVRSLTPGIWTTDRTGLVGYNSGDTTEGDPAGNYTNSFGGTSSACPGAAGVAALVLSRNPNLRWDEVREVLRQSCDRIDPAGGKYDANGHSPLYGYGRLNARTAAQLAEPSPTPPGVLHSVTRNVRIADMSTAQLALQVPETRVLKSLKVTVDIEHTYVGDLIVTLQPPNATGAGPIVLHNRQGGAAHDLRNSYDQVNAPGLAALVGKKPNGAWTLIVEDQAPRDTGWIRSLTLELQF